MRIPINLQRNSQGIQNPNTVDRNYGMQGLQISNQAAQVDQQTGQIMSGAIRGAANDIGRFVKDRQKKLEYEAKVRQQTKDKAGKAFRDLVEKDDGADGVSARQKYLDNYQEWQQKAQGTNNPKDMEKLTQEYQKKGEAMIEGKSDTGVPNFRNPSGKARFREWTQKFNGDWGRTSNKYAFDMNNRNSAARLELTNAKLLKNGDVDDPSTLAELLENNAALAGFGVTEGEIAVGKEKIISQMSDRRASHHISKLGDRFENMINTTGYDQQVVKDELKQYSEYVGGLENMSKEKKEVYLERAENLGSLARKQAIALQADHEAAKRKGTFEASDTYSKMRAEGKSLKERGDFIKKNWATLPKAVKDAYGTEVQSNLEAQNKAQGKEQKEYIEKKTTQQKSVELIDKFTEITALKKGDLNDEEWFKHKIMADQLKADNIPGAAAYSTEVDRLNPMKESKEDNEFLEFGNDVLRDALNLNTVTGDKTRNEAAIRTEWEGLDFQKRKHLNLQVNQEFRQILRDPKGGREKAQIFMEKKVREIQELTVKSDLVGYYNNYGSATGSAGTIKKTEEKVMYQEVNTPTGSARVYSDGRIVYEDGSETTIEKYNAESAAKKKKKQETKKDINSINSVLDTIDDF